MTVATETVENVATVETETVENVASETVETVSKRVEANRKNAQKSTGPQTEAGKLKVSLNAMKHGLTAASLVLPGESADSLQARIVAFKLDLKPRSPLEEYIAERVAICSWQLDRCDRAITSKQSEWVNFGLFDLEEAETEQVEDLTRQLFWDPRGPIALYPHFRGFRYKPRVSGGESLDDPIQPAKIVNNLASLYGGCWLLLESWTNLRRLLEDGLKWQAPDRLKAIRLLGRQPMDALADERVLMICLACDAMEPGGPTSLDDLVTETTDDELKLFKERVKGRGADRKKPASPEAGKAALLSLIDETMAPLADKLAVHRAHQAFLKSAHLDFLAFDDSKEGELRRRYRLAKGREFNRLLAIYYKVQREALAAVAKESDPPGSDLESRLQAAVGPDIPSEAITPIIQPADSTLSAADSPEIPAEAETPANHPSDSPVPAEGELKPGSETNPNPAEPPIPAPAQPAQPDLVMAPATREDTPQSLSQRILEALRLLEKRPMS